jgi:hypothetical protein
MDRNCERLHVLGQVLAIATAPRASGDARFLGACPPRDGLGLCFLAPSGMGGEATEVSHGSSVCATVAVKCVIQARTGIVGCSAVGKARAAVPRYSILVFSGRARMPAKRVASSRIS